MSDESPATADPAAPTPGEVVPAAPSAAPVPVADAPARPIGLEDIEDSDLVIPRLTIVQNRAVFKDSLSNEEFPELTVIILGLVKQRVLWPAEVASDNQPMCKSFDHKTGRADPGQFPWAASGFKREDYDEEQPKFECKACPLQKWGSHPTRDIPWCTEQWVLPLMMETGSPALFTVQRSSIRNTKAYISGFAGPGKSPFGAFTKLTLTAQKRGSVDYAVPNFAKVGDVPEERWGALADSALSIREFLQTPRSFADERDPETAAEAPASPEAAAAAAEEIPF